MTSLRTVMPRHRPRSRFCGIAVFMLAIVAALPRPLSARMHIGLARSVPAKGAHLTTAPTEIRLTFTGPINVARAGVELLAADGAAVATDPLTAVPDSHRVAVAKIVGALNGGTYTVKWRAVARDGAAGSGSFTFMYMRPADTQNQSLSGTH